MADLIAFPLTLRSPGRPVDRDDAEVLPFPYGRRRQLVERHARAMRAMSEDAAEAYLIGVLEKICDELKAIGIDCDDCQGDEIYEFAAAVGRQLHRCVAGLKVEGGAE